MSGMPEVTVYPECSTCRIPWVLRRCHDLSGGNKQWLWQRDCKHRSAEPNTVVAPVAPEHESAAEK